jgi:hypothetical protein
VLPNTNFRNQELTKRFFHENQEKNQKLFSKESGNHQDRFSKKSGGISETFLNQDKQESIRQFSLGGAKLSLLQTLVICLDQANNEDNCLTSEIKERER